SFFFSSRRRHTRFSRDWSSDVCSSDLLSPESGNSPANTPDGCFRRTGRTQGGDDQAERRRELQGGQRVVRERVEQEAAGEGDPRSEERRVGKERRARGSQSDNKEKGAV